MQSKLIYTHYWSDNHGCSGMEVIPFTYSRKDEFLYNIREKYKNIIWERNTTVQILGVFLYEEDFKDLENNIMDLDDWFEQNKI